MPKIDEENGAVTLNSSGMAIPSRTEAGGCLDLGHHDLRAMDLGCLGLTPAEGTTPGGVTQRRRGERRRNHAAVTQNCIYS